MTGEAEPQAIPLAISALARLDQSRLAWEWLRRNRSFVADAMQARTTTSYVDGVRVVHVPDVGMAARWGVFFR